MTQAVSTSSSAPTKRRTSMGTLCSGLLIGAASCCILAVVAGLWIGGRFAQEHLSSDRRQTVEGMTSGVSSALHSLLGANDLSAVRRVLVELRQVPGVSRATLLFPDGKVIADSDTKAIEVAALPKTWRTPIDPDLVGATDGSFILQTIDLAGRGQLFLRLTVRPDAPAFGVAEYTGLGVAAIIALLVALAARRRLLQRMAAITTVSDALHALATADEPLEQLRVSDVLGQEAADWNRAIDRFLALQRDSKAGAVRSLLNEGPAARAGEGGGTELNSTIDLLPTGVIVVDSAAGIRTLNGAAAALLGADRKDLVGVDARTLLEGQAFSDAIHASQHGGERRTLEIDRTNSSGGILRINVRPLRREDNGGALVTVEDITQQRIADDSRNKFVAQATHELRAPLTNMRLCLETALDDDASDLEAITRHLNVLNDETRRLERLVSEMLSVAEIEAGSLRLKADDVKIDRLFEELKADHQPACAEKNLELTFELPPKFPQVHGDRDKLAAALHNLLNNAVKYTPSGGKITVSARQDGDRFVIDISDTGFGIPAEDQPRIFERFFRASDPRVSKITGTGLGLALSREVARLHGGELTFKSEHNRGTTFTLQVPVALQPA